jgi:hypothetical protein
MQQLEFPNLRHVSEARIAAAFGVPSILVGLKVGLDAGIRATIQDQRRYFTETTLANRWRRISDTLTGNLAWEFGDNLVLRFDLDQVAALAEQSRFSVQPIKEAFMAGAATLDEYRVRALHLPPLPGEQGQFLMVPLASQPVPLAEDAVTLLDTIADETNDYAGKGVAGAPHPHRGNRTPRANPLAVMGVRPVGHAAGDTPQRESGWERDATPWGRGKPGTGGRPIGPEKQLRRKRVSARHKERVNWRGGPESTGLGRLAAALGQQGVALGERAQRHGGAKLLPPADLTTADERATLAAIVRDIWADTIRDAFRHAGEELGLDLEPNFATGAEKALLDGTDGRIDGLLATAADRAGDAPHAADHEHLHAYQRAGVAQVEVEDDSATGCAACKAAHGSTWTVDYALLHPLEHPGCGRHFIPVIEDAGDDGRSA